MWLRTFLICLPAALLMSACTAHRNGDLRLPPTLRAADQQRRPPLSQQETRKLLDAGQFASLDEHFSAAQAAYELGASNDEELRADFRVFYDTDPALAARYDQWISRFPKSYVALLARGLYYAKVGESARGVHSVEDTPQRNLDETQVAFDMAMRDLEASLALTRKPLLTYSYEIIISHTRGDIKESRRLLDRAIAIDPNNYVVRGRYMGSIETRWGGSQTMMKAFLEECRRANLSDRQLRLLESVIVEDEGWIHLYVDGNYSAAEAAYRRSAALGGDNSLPNLADAMMKQSKYQEVIPLLSEGLRENPRDPDVLERRGEAYMNTGKPGEAIADFTAAAAAGSANAQNELGRLYMMGVPGVLDPDINAGINFFRQSAAQGNAAGQQNLQQALKYYSPHPIGK